MKIFFSYPMYQPFADKNGSFSGVLARSGVDLTSLWWRERAALR